MMGPLHLQADMHSSTRLRMYVALFDERVKIVWYNVAHILSFYQSQVELFLFTVINIKRKISLFLGFRPQTLNMGHVQVMRGG